MEKGYSIDYIYTVDYSLDIIENGLLEIALKNAACTGYIMCERLGLTEIEANPRSSAALLITNSLSLALYQSVSGVMVAAEALKVIIGTIIHSARTTAMIFFMFFSLEKLRFFVLSLVLYCRRLIIQEKEPLTQILYNGLCLLSTEI
jgi:hypothetical protein